MRLTVVPENCSRASRGQGISHPCTSAGHSSAPQIPSEQFGEGGGHRTRRNAFLKTARADDPRLRAESQEEIPGLLPERSHSTAVTVAQACQPHLTHTQHSPWEGSQGNIPTHNSISRKPRVYSWRKKTHRLHTTNTDEPTDNPTAEIGCFHGVEGLMLSR